MVHMTSGVKLRDCKDIRESISMEGLYEGMIV